MYNFSMDLDQELLFSQNLVKGRIVEVIFEQMIRNEGNYTVIPFGYEHTVPMLAQYQRYVDVRHVIKNISHAPDFALISNDKSKLFLVEVKYQKRLNIDDLKLYSSNLLKKWDYPWLFVATEDGFYCGLASWILEEGRINELSDNWVSSLRRTHYLDLLKNFV